MRNRRTAQTTLAAAVLAFGVAFGTAACSSDGGSDDGNKTAKSAKAACEILKGLPAVMPEPQGGNGNNAEYDAATGRYTAALSLASAAAAVDPKYQPLADALKEGSNKFTAAFDVHALEPAAEKARGLC